MRTLPILLAALALAFAPVGALAQSVGVTAAVNPSTKGTPPGGGVRTIALGDNIIHNERVVTDAAGLVQILFVDGTTLMMGPNSDLVIDSFFYDPNAGTAQVAVTMTKGVLRFIGGLTSKTPDGASIGTPVGTIGIRGGIVDVDLETSDGTPQHVDMLFGTEVTLEQGQALLGRLYQGGYSLVLGADGNVSVQKTPPEWSSQIQQALAGKPGTSGGAGSQPTDETVADSGVPDANSESSLPGLDGPPLTAEEIEQLLLAVATYDELRDSIEEPEEPRGTTYPGASAGILHVRNLDASGNPEGPDRWEASVTTGTSFETASLALIEIDDSGTPIAGFIDITGVDLMSCADCRVRFAIENGEVRYNPDDLPPGATVSALTANLLRNDQVTLPAGVDYCECAFLDWGFWNLHAEIDEADSTSTIFNVTNGTWVVGTFSTAAELEIIADQQEMAGTYATYAGHAIGSATNGGSSYLAAGQMEMNWRFADREGELGIFDFDGRDFHATITGTEGTPFFAGPLYDVAYGTGAVRGAFVNDGSTPAAGVGGDFVMQDGSWSAAGIFAGARGDDGFID